MFATSHRILNILAAGVWIIGGVVLLLKSGSLLAEAAELHPKWLWPTLSATIGVVVGGLKSRLIFRKSCHKNLNRITALVEPKLWQFFSPRFFLFLALMITAGATLSRMAEGRYALLLAVGALDLTIAVALLGSCPVFWQRRAFQPA
ncbi:MAG: hypothetical protein Kow0031_09730 [Anaerolineae bacterium]